MNNSAGFALFSFRLLGPLEIHRGDALVPVTLTRMPRRLLVALLFEAPNYLSVAKLDDRAFGHPAAGNTRQRYLSQIRRHLEPYGTELLQQSDNAYRITIDPGTIDVTRFRAAHSLGRAAAGRDDQAAAGQLRTALGYWSGEALEGIGDGWWMEQKRLELTTERRAAELLLHRIGLRTGAGDTLAELARIHSEQPADEEVAALLMVALYAAGNPHRALAVFGHHAQYVRRELATGPSSLLSSLREQISAGRLEVASWLGGERPAPPTSTEPAPAPTVRRNLPRALPNFVGRRDEIAELDRKAPTSSVIVIDGPPGVGKSALAVHWAHRNAERYPGGQLHLNLRGFDPSGVPVDESEAMRRLLTGLGIKPRDIEPDPADRADQYREEVAGRRILLVLDNAANEQQVRSLIPADPESLVIVTSRRRLPGLRVSHQATFVPLKLPGDVEARELFRGYLDSRASGSPADIDRIVQWTGRMPLALAIIGARAASSPERSLREILEELRSGIATTDEGDPLASVGAALAWSYHHLSDVDRATFRLLGLHPGPELEARAVAALAGIDGATAARSLSQLSAVRLIEESGSRYTLHDLVREYAAGTPPASTDEPDHRRPATRRLLDFYLHSGDALATLLRPRRQPMPLDPPAPGVVPVVAGTEAAAIEWFGTEYPVLMRLIQAAEDLDFPTYAWKILTTMLDFLEWQGHWAGWRDASKAALDAAEHAGDRAGAARSTRAMGRAFVQSGQYEEGERLLRTALAMYSDLDDPDGAMRVHHDLGDLLIRQDRHREALTETSESLRLTRQTNNEHEEANCLGGIAWCHLELGAYDKAAAFATEANTIHQRTGYARGEAAAQDTLGVALHKLGLYEQAEAGLQRSVELCRRVGDRFSEAIVLDHLADCLAESGGAGAGQAWRSSFAILEEMNHPLAAEVAEKLKDEAEEPVQGGQRTSISKSE